MSMAMAHAVGRASVASLDEGWTLGLLDGESVEMIAAVVAPAEGTLGAAAGDDEHAARASANTVQAAR